MKKVFSSLIFSLIFLSGGISLVAQSVGDYIAWGYCDNEDPIHGQNIGWYPEQLEGKRVGVWARYTSADLKQFKDCRIIGVRIAAGSGVKNAQVALLSALSSPTIVKAKSVELKFGWNEVVFDEPQPITGEGQDIIYGYSFSPSDATAPADAPSRYGIVAIDRTKPIDPNSHYVNLIGDKMGSLSPRAEESGAIRMQLMIAGAPEKINDKAKLFTPILNYLADENGKVTLSMGIDNRGANAIKSIKVDFSVSGDKRGVQSFDVDIPKFGKTRVNVQPLTLKNNETLTVTIVEINGTAVSQKGFDLPIQGIGDKAFDRKVLIEQYSTESCASCPAAHRYLHKVLEEDQYKDKYVWITHHEAYYADPYTLPESKDFLYLFGENDKAAPSWSLDRTTSGTVDIEGYDVPLHPMQPVMEQENRELLREAMARLAWVSLDIEENCDPATRKLDIKISSKAIMETMRPDLDNVYLNILLIEDDIYTTEQKGNKGQPFIHHGTIRQFLLNGSKGQKVNYDAEGNYSFSTSTTIPKEWSAANVRIVAYLAKSISGQDVQNSHVYNSNETKIKAYASICPTAPEAIKASLYAHEGTISTADDAHIEAIYDLNGQQCTNGTLAAGVYVVVLQTPAGTFPCKVVMR